MDVQIKYRIDVCVSTLHDSVQIQTHISNGHANVQCFQFHMFRSRSVNDSVCTEHMYVCNVSIRIESTVRRAHCAYNISNILRAMAHKWGMHQMCWTCAVSQCTDTAANTYWHIYYIYKYIFRALTIIFFINIFAGTWLCFSIHIAIKSSNENLNKIAI